GLAKPEEEGTGTTSPASVSGGPVEAPMTMAVAAGAAASAGAATLPKRSFGIQGLVRGPLVKVGSIEDRTLFSWPNLFQAELLVFVISVAAILVVSLFFNAPLEEPVNVMHPPNPAKAPWYFLGLQEQVSYSAFWGGVGVPGIELLLLMLLPYFDRGKAGIGRWFARQRILANSLFLVFVIANVILIVIGTFFRGANWQFVSPF